MTGSVAIFLLFSWLTPLFINTYYNKKGGMSIWHTPFRYIIITSLYYGYTATKLINTPSTIHNKETYNIAFIFLSFRCNTMLVQNKLYVN